MSKRLNRPSVACGANINQRWRKLVRKLNPVTMTYYDCWVKVKAEKVFKGIRNWSYNPTKGYRRYSGHLT